MVEQNSAHNSGNAIYVLGQELLLEFGNLLADTLEQNLSARWGSNWFEECLSDGGRDSRSSKRDLHFLLKEIVDRNNHNFRNAVASAFFATSTLHRTQIESLASLMKARNLWAHPERTIVLKDLKKLSLAMISLLASDHPLNAKCQKVMLMSENKEHFVKVAVLTNFFDYLVKSSVLTPSANGDVADLYAKFSNSNYKTSGTVAAQESSPTYEDQALVITGMMHFIEDLSLSFQLVEGLCASAILDMTIDMRHPQSAYPMVSNDQLLELKADIDIESKLVNITSMVEEIRTERGRIDCECFYCLEVGVGAPHLLYGKPFVKALRLMDRLVRLEPADDLFEVPCGYIGFLNMKILVCTIAARNGQDLEYIVNNWDFTFIDKRLNDDPLFGIEGSAEIVTQLLAVCNGIPFEEVKSWNFD